MRCRTAILTILLVALCSPSISLAVSRVQTKSNVVTTNLSVGVTPTSNLTVGNMVAGYVFWNNTTSTFSSLSDSCGNTYTTQTPVTYVSTFSAVAYTAPVTTGGSCTITATISANAPRLSISVHEMSSGTSVELDKYNMSGVASTSTPASPSVTTTADGEYVIGGNVNGAARTYTAGTNCSFTVRETDSFSYATEDCTQTSAGSLAADWTMSGSSATISGIMTFKDSAAASAPCTLTLLGVGRC